MKPAAFLTNQMAGGRNSLDFAVMIYYVPTARLWTGFGLLY